MGGEKIGIRCRENEEVGRAVSAEAVTMLDPFMAG